jgi:glucose-6-phosphate isomerase
MAELEKGAIANPDEKRMVGHYWLRNPALAPTAEIRDQIEKTITEVKAFAAEVHRGAVRGAKGRFENLLLIGIGGSALGPQFVSHALGHPARDKLRFFSFDNTDPDGMDRVLAEIGPALGQTLCLVISKSGGTKETHNGMLEVKAAYQCTELDFGQHAVAITLAGSDLDKYAAQNGWIKRFPMWDWVGGRTSELSAVGLLPAALQGIDIDSLLEGARRCDEVTRNNNVTLNPSALLSLAWHHAGNGIGSRSMIVIPYKDRLELFSKYLQQLVMESIGKEKDLDGMIVNQGMLVLGNKGSTDQHSYIQQLRDGQDRFFATFVEVLRDRSGPSIEVEPGVRSGDYLRGFLTGTRQALYDKNRLSLTITIGEVKAFSVGVLIALFERAVGLYASLLNINAYHQPGVEAGKKAAAAIIELQLLVIRHLSARLDDPLSVRDIANGIRRPDEMEMVFKICEQLAANPDRKVRKLPGPSPFESRYRMS